MGRFEADGRLTITPIGKIKTEFPTKFGIPRQSGLASSTIGAIYFEKEYRDSNAVRGMEGFSHLWLIWGFTKSGRDGWSPTVRPPRLGGNTRLGVFATRSPFRPNPLALTVVKLERIDYSAPDGPVIYVGGADIMDGTSIYDIKPYLPYADSVPDAVGGFTDDAARRVLTVNFPPELIEKVPEDLRRGLTEVLAQDPRPAYQTDGERVYGMPFGTREIKFNVADGVLTVLDVE